MVFWSLLLSSSSSSSSPEQWSGASEGQFTQFGAASPAGTNGEQRKTAFLKRANIILRVLYRVRGVLSGLDGIGMGWKSPGGGGIEHVMVLIRDTYPAWLSNKLFFWRCHTHFCVLEDSNMKMTKVAHWPSICSYMRYYWCTIILYMCLWFVAFDNVQGGFF